MGRRLVALHLYGTAILHGNPHATFHLAATTAAGAHPLHRSCLRRFDLIGHRQACRHGPIVHAAAAVADDAQAGWRIIQAMCGKRGFEPKTRPVLTPSTIENLSTPLNNCVLLFPGKNKEISFLSQLKKYACIPLADDDALFPVFAAWMPEKSAEVAPFLAALDEALAIMTTPA